VPAFLGPWCMWDTGLKWLEERVGLLAFVFYKLQYLNPDCSRAPENVYYGNNGSKGLTILLASLILATDNGSVEITHGAFR
jgi:hypothetical protein